MAGLGHNNGPSMEPGQSWRRYAWTRARAELMPTLPIEVVRRRVKRAAELGLPYKTYAGIRASTGHDLIGFMFSTNALRMLRAGQTLPAEVADKLDALTATQRVGLAHRPITPADLASLPQIDAAYTAPQFHQSWPEMRDQMKLIAYTQGVSGDRYVLIGETAFEREWAEAGKMAGFLTGQRFFAEFAGSVG